jgi:hypothetical protein
VLALLTNGGNANALFRELVGGLLADVAGVEIPADVTPPESEPAFDPSAYLGVYERESVSIEVLVRDGKLVAVETVTGIAAELTPNPFELPLHAFDVDHDVFLTHHPAAPDTWLPVQFLTLSDGSRCLHFGGRATPRSS